MAITNFWLSDGQESEFDEWDILNVETAERPIPSTEFEVAPFVHEKQWQHHVYTNGAFYERTAGGLNYLETLTVPRWASFSDKQRQYWLISLYVGWGAMNFVISALIVGVRKQNQQTKQEMNESYEIQV